MYICIHVYMHIRTHVYIHIYECIYVYVYAYMCTYPHTVQSSDKSIRKRATWPGAAAHAYNSRFLGGQVGWIT